MANEITRAEKEKLFKQTRVMLGAPQVGVEISDEALEVLLTVSIEEYSAYINNWLIQQQWGSLQNINIEQSDLVFALTTKTLDFEKSFTFAYSKQAGVGTNSPWELKKDYIILTGGTQLYTIPAGREVNEVLWSTPPQIGSGYGPNNGLSPVGWEANGYGWNYNGMAAGAVLPAFNMFLTTQNTKMIKQILQSDLTYKINGGPLGTKILQLYPVPGSRDEIHGQTSYGTGNNCCVDGAAVWYWYYDTNEKDRDECLEANNDIIKLPSDVPLNNIPWGKLNDAAKANVRRLLIAEGKLYLAQVRGKFGGALDPANAKGTVTMDYSFFIDQYDKDKNRVYEDLSKFLGTLTYRQLMEDKAAISESLNTVMKNTPSVQSIFMI